jgi:hypothetical protein
VEYPHAPQRWLSPENEGEGRGCLAQVWKGLVGARAVSGGENMKDNRRCLQGKIMWKKNINLFIMFIKHRSNCSSTLNHIGLYEAKFKKSI